jgi:hypothetical protein
VTLLGGVAARPASPAAPGPAIEAPLPLAACPNAARSPAGRDQPRYLGREAADGPRHGIRQASVNGCGSSPDRNRITGFSS